MSNDPIRPIDDPEVRAWFEAMRARRAGYVDVPPEVAKRPALRGWAEILIAEVLTNR